MTVREITDGKQTFLPLLLEADPDEKQVLRYLGSVDVYGFYDDRKLQGIICVLPGKNEWEIKNLAVEKESRNKGIGQKLVRHVEDAARRGKVPALIVGTGNSSIGNFAFYQKCGFRFRRIVPDFFTENYAESIWENGILCRDLVVFEKSV
jgi:ribosomal protein S18 acetylase RimI-like enzyme